MVCQEPECVAEATADSRYCAIHDKGYHRCDGSYPLQCSRCDRWFSKGEWYQLVDGRVVHVRPCEKRPGVK